MQNRSVIDCDIHPSAPQPAEVMPYLSRGWRNYVEMPGGGKLVPTTGALTTVAEQPLGVHRLDSYPTDGHPPGSSYELLCEQLLDPSEITVALLTQVTGPTTPNGELAAALCTAWNEWMRERWLQGEDERLYGTLLVPQDPVKGAAEIRRAGNNEKFAAAMLTRSIGRPLGDESYDPIYEAASELGLPLYVHSNGAEVMGGGAPSHSGGAVIHYRLELYATVHHAMAMHLTTMIARGVFERFPDLRLMVAEQGIAWVPWLFARLDSSYPLMKRDSKWVRRLPSDYLREHVTFTTQPVEASPHNRGDFTAYLSTTDGVEDVLCFSSDYPHWDGDEPAFIASILPDSWHQKVFYANARRALRLPDDVRTADSPAHVRA